MKHIVCPRCGSLNRLPPDRPATTAKCGACHLPLFTGHAAPVDAEGFDRHIQKNDIPVLIDMWAPWCGPCRAMAPMFETAATQLEPDVRLLKLNVDEAPETAARFGVRGIPALLLFRDGRVIAQSAGAQSAEAVIHWTRSHIAAPSAAGG